MCGKENKTGITIIPFLVYLTVNHQLKSSPMHFILCLPQKCSPQSCADNIPAAVCRRFYPSLTPSVPSPLLLRTGWISTLGPPSVALQWHHLKFALVTQPMHHRQRADSPNDRARRCRVGGNLNLKQPGWLKWKNCRWEKKRRRKIILTREI